MKILNVEKNNFDSLKFKTSGPKNKTIYNKEILFYKGDVEMESENIKTILITSDLQGRELGDKNRLIGEVVAEKVSSFCKVDISILAGDFYDDINCKKRSAFGDVSAVWNKFAEISEYVVGVNGNHDIVDANNLKDNITILDGNKINIGEINFTGISGVMGNPRKNQRRLDTDFLFLLNKIITKKTDVIILHQGPDNGTDYKGDVAIKEIIKNKYDGLLIFGHCFWQKDWFVNIGRSQALNVDNRVIILNNIKGKK